MSEAKIAVEELHARYVHALDDGRLEDWPDFFTEDGVYRITTAENEARGLPLPVLLAESRAMLRDRVQSLRHANIYEPLRRHTWARILDEKVPVYAIVAETKADGVIGIANYLVHEHTLGLTPACYLGDLFVEPKVRAGGVGYRLIDWLRQEQKRQ